ncbi:MAG TPA: amidohydrolase family protein [Longimicrobiales bacterium]|nr:amidohydrolase family protein [Longimicrobiales bacterium]
MRTLIMISALVAVAPLEAQTIAITGGTVYPVAGPRIENGTVLVRDGRIVAVGSNVSIPADAQRIDATGRWVTPGLVNPWTSVGIVEIGLSAGPSDNEARGSNAIAASFRPWDALNAETPLIAQARFDGITTLGVAPSGNLIAGQHALMSLEGSTAQQLLLRAPTGMVAQLGNSAAGGANARGELIARLREVLEDARAWPRRRAAVEENRSRPLSATPADFEALQPVLSRAIPLMITVERAAEIDAALGLARDFNIRVVLVGAAEAWMRAAELAAANVPVVVGGIRNIPGDFNTLNARGDNAALLRRAGVMVLLFSDSYGDGGSFNARNVRFEAGNAVANGMTWDDALRAVTLAPATTLGVADRIGSLEAGRDANIVVWSGDPFEFATQAEVVLVRGVRATGQTREQELTERYRTLPPRWR